MFKRLFFAMLGLGAGVALGVYAVRRIDETRRRLSPEHLAAVAAGRAGGLKERLASAMEQGRLAADEKEAELRAVYRGGTGTAPAREIG